MIFFWLSLHHAYVVGTHLNCIDLSMQFRWVPTTSAFVKKWRKKYTGCNLKTTEFLDCALIGVCAVIRSNTVYNFDPFKPHFYIVKLDFIGVYIIFLISAQKHRLWVLTEAVLTSTHNLCFEQKYERYQKFLSENFSFFFFGGEIFNIFE